MDTGHGGCTSALGRVGLPVLDGALRGQSAAADPGRSARRICSFSGQGEFAGLLSPCASHNPCTFSSGHLGHKNHLLDIHVLYPCLFRPLRPTPSLPVTVADLNVQEEAERPDKTWLVGKK